jgi:uncharacterized protein
MEGNLMVIKILLIIAALILIEIYFETNFPKIALVNIRTDKFKAKGKIKVLQITDYHNFKYNSRILRLVREAQPDMIVITGDLIDKVTKEYSNVYSFAKELTHINPNVYYVPGNHELESGNMDSLLEDIAKKNVRVLINNNEVGTFQGDSINICGIDYSSTERGDLAKTLYGINTGLYTILLCHKPDIIKDYSDIPCDLILCGHTHGGQIRFPLMGAVIAPDQGLFPKYNKGLYKIDNDTTLYIDSGVGTTRLPVRVMNRSQISLIEIEKV